MIGIVVPVVGTAATVLATSAKGGDSASPPPTVTVSPPPASPSSSAAQPSTAPPSRSTSPSPEGTTSEPAPEGVPLTTLDPLEGYYDFKVTSADLNGREYADALVSDKQCPGRASITYNLGRDWKRFRATVGVDDDSTEPTATLTIHGDDTVLSRKPLAVGKPEELNLRVENVLRLTISYSFEGCYIPDAWVVLADPTLS